jgi:hypothetical protein
MLTEREVGSVWEVSSRLSGPPFLNSLLGVMTQKPPPESPTVHHCTVLSLLSMEY